MLSALAELRGGLLTSALIWTEKDWLTFQSGICATQERRVRAMNTGELFLAGRDALLNFQMKLIEKLADRGGQEFLYCLKKNMLDITKIFFVYNSVDIEKNNLVDYVIPYYINLKVTCLTFRFL